ncbi:uncharacterized protein LOC125664581 isoform X2 [Ostrea edulis]|uniref:uncharacterized protein LOC125664581 isoform X2 n=1 Tax=Ostrea edulis TaxID=37623 RepID=UPI0024AF104A|nr:uncharacterized protein LOC125664581 isoform X2 [Ostrea edulis]
MTSDMESSSDSPSTSHSLDECRDVMLPRRNSSSRKRKRKKDDCCGTCHKISKSVKSTEEHERVSDWKIYKLDKIGLSYKSQSSTVDDFFRTVEKFGFGPLSDEKREVSLSLTRLTKEIMTDTSFNMTRKENAAYCIGELEKCVEVTREIKPVWGKLVTEGQLSWYHAQSLVYLLNFYEQLTLFLRARSMVTAHPPVKANYTALLSSFVHIFLLKAKQGAELRCVTSIEGEPTSAVPDLRLVNIGSMQDIERNFTVCVINVVEVKKTRRRGDSLEGCDICSAVWDDLLARHAGCLLLEYPNTQYASKDCDTKVIQGIICMETQLIFTWLEVSDVHYADIKEGNVSEKMRDTPRGRSADIKEGNVSEKMRDTPRGRSADIKEGNVSEKMRDTPRGRSADIKEGNVSEKMRDTPRGRSAGIKEGNVSEKMKDTLRGRSADIKEGNVSEKMRDTPRGRRGMISYTRPYDYLLKDDREQILEFLYRLGLQSEGKSTADIKN